MSSTSLRGAFGQKPSLTICIATNNIEYISSSATRKRQPKLQNTKRFTNGLKIRFRACVVN